MERDIRLIGNLVADMTARCCAQPHNLYTAIRGPTADPRPDLPMRVRELCTLLSSGSSRSFFTKSVVRSRSLYCSVHLRRDILVVFTSAVTRLLADSLAYINKCWLLRLLWRLGRCPRGRYGLDTAARGAGDRSGQSRYFFPEKLGDHPDGGQRSRVESNA
jgi:hypothetical protein